MDIQRNISAVQNGRKKHAICAISNNELLYVIFDRIEADLCVYHSVFGYAPHSGVDRKHLRHSMCEIQHGPICARSNNIVFDRNTI